MKNKHLKLIAATTIALVLVGCAFYFYRTTLNSKKSSTESADIDMSAPTDEQIKDGQNTKKDIIKKDQDLNDSASAPTAAEVSMYTSAKNVDNDNVNIRVIIDGAHSGNCTITLTKGAATVTRVALIQSQASTSTCQGFTIPLSELSSGLWSYTISAKMDSGSHSAQTSGEVEL